MSETRTHTATLDDREPEEIQKKTKSRRPANTAFRQQRLKAWQPILTPKTVLPLFFTVGIIFAPIGGLLLYASAQVQELSIDYSQCRTAGNSSAFVKIPDKYVSSSFKGAGSNCSQGDNQWKGNSTTRNYDGVDQDTFVCSLIFNIPDDLDPPVLLYYRLTNFYQNHRRYVKSLDSDQLKGTAVKNSSLGACDPLDTNKTAGGKPIYPCGLIANSVFNDTFSNPTQLNPKLSKDDNNDSAAGIEYNMTEKGIAWSSDAALYNPTKYKIEDIVPPPNWVLRYPNGYTAQRQPPNLKEDEAFQVWMRTAGLPNFSKLAKRNDNETMQCSMYRVDIDDNFVVTKYGGTKSMVISTRTVMGGKNPFLGIAYVAVGGICIVLGTIFTATHLIKPSLAQRLQPGFLDLATIQPKEYLLGLVFLYAVTKYRWAFWYNVIAIDFVFGNGIMLLQTSLFLFCYAVPLLAGVIDSRVVEHPDKHPDLPLQVCGTQPPNDDLRQTHSSLQRGGTQSRLQNLAVASSTGQINVQVYMHIVATNDQAPRYSTKLRNKIILNQIAVLNKSYQSANISFHLNSTSYTIRNDWATDANSTLMKKSLRRGTYADLNLYFQTNLSSAPYTYSAASTLLGYCTLPTTITYPGANGQPVEYPAIDYATDGCNILAGSMPGNPVALKGYDQGKTAVHEVGHWFGLLHTFQDNSCTPGDPGDYVDDTPQEAVSTSGCPTGKNSCPNRPGRDPISNYMDYSTDDW
ncbi:alkylphosphocholine resistance protein lem3 [Lecanora helva]